MVGRDVVVVGQGLLVAFDRDGVLLALKPPSLKRFLVIFCQ